MAKRIGFATGSGGKAALFSAAFCGGVLAIWAAFATVLDAGLAVVLASEAAV